MAGEAVASTNGIATPSQRDLDREAELVRRAKAQSPEAWTEIYEQNHQRLFRYVQARVGDRETAEDLTATVFLEALKSIGSYTSRGRPLLAWLYTIARNVVSYHHRSLFRKQLASGATADKAPGVAWRILRLKRPGERGEAEEPAAGSGQRGDPASLVEAWDLRQAVNRLSPDQREVIILRYFVGLSTPDVAGLVGKQERAVYSLQTRAIKALRRHLG